MVRIVNQVCNEEILLLLFILKIYIKRLNFKKIFIMINFLRLELFFFYILIIDWFVVINQWCMDFVIK